MNAKKSLCAALALFALLTAAIGVSGAADENELPLSPIKNDYTAAAEKLQELGILKGDGNGDLMLENTVTRYQTALFFAQILTGKTETSVWNQKKNSDCFTDVIDYAGAIDMLAKDGKIIGIGGGRFGYNSNILYRDMLVLCVRLLGEESEGMTYPADYLSKANSLGLCSNIDTAPDAELRRGETAQLMFNLLGKAPKGESETLLAAFERQKAAANETPAAPDDTVDTVGGSDEAYMLAMPDYAVELGNDTRYKYRLTVSGLYDLHAGARVTPFSIATDTLSDNKLYTAVPGALVYFNGNKRVTVCENLCTDEVDDKVKARFVDLYSFDSRNKGARFIDAADLRIPSGDTAVCAPLALDGEAALSKMNIRVRTLNMTTPDTADYDFDGAYLDRAYDAADGFDAPTVTVDGKEVYAYPLLTGDEELDAPTEGIFDDFILAAAGETVRVPRKGDSEKTAEVHIRLFIVGAVERGVLDLSVLKLIVE